ncbi:hypothetical protein V2J52_13260 [Georgenia sp. MJ173]
MTSPNRYAVAATASAAQARNSTQDPAIQKLAEAVEYLGYAIAEMTKEDS